MLDPVAFLRRLAAWIPAPYTHMVRYFGVFANRGRFRPRLPPPPVAATIAAMAPPASAQSARPAPLPAASPDDEPSPGSRHHTWARPLRRVLDNEALTCPRCFVPMVVLAFLSNPPVVRKILDHLKIPSAVPPVDLARRPQDLLDITPDGYIDREDQDLWPDDPTPRPPTTSRTTRSPP